MARVKKFNKYVYIGNYPNKYDAFYAYKREKEYHIKKIAKMYKDKIPKILYDAMNKYIVNIDD